MIASGGCSAAVLSASSAVVAVTTSYPAPRRFVLQRAEELRLVVDDEDPGHAGTGAGQLDERQRDARTMLPGLRATRATCGRRSPR